MNWWRKLKRETGNDFTDLPKLRVGSKWILGDDKENPFERKCIATVDDIKEGWVRYHLGKAPEMWSLKWTLKADKFVSLYLPLEEETWKEN